MAVPPLITLLTDFGARDAYVAAGSEPFRPTSKQTMQSYYQVPADILEDDEQLNAWAVAAVLTRRRQDK